MKKISRIFTLVLVLLAFAVVFASCDDDKTPDTTTTEDVGTTSSESETEQVTTTVEGDTSSSEEETSTTEKVFVDYASQLKLNMNSDTKKAEVTVKYYIDGDTTHFFINDKTFDGGVVKARYLAINTPESTGDIEDYGGDASNFTHTKLQTATSIIIESDDDKWNTDSNGRHLLWIWYIPEGETEYRNLNLEILQNGLALASDTSGNRYGSICNLALKQARDFKLMVYSGVPDPEVYRGEAITLSIKELRCNIEKYNGKRVAITGVVTYNNNNSIYMESYDEETDMYFGMTAYYGYNLAAGGLKAIKIGNLARVVGTVSYYEAGGTYQLSALKYNMMKPNDPENCKKLEEGHEPAHTELTGQEFKQGTVSVNVGTEEEPDMKDMRFADAAIHTSVSMKNLKVTKIYTTKNEDSASKGAMTLTCTAEDGTEIAVRTVVLKDENGNIVTDQAYLNKTIDVYGIIDLFDGTYQIKVFSTKGITVHS